MDLKGFEGKWTVLYFYPKDDTPGCTLEAKAFSHLKDKFKRLGVQVIGVSPDTKESHEKFMNKHGLELDALIADTEKKLIDRFEVWKEKQMYGRKYMGVERSTFILDPEGNVVEEWQNVRPKGHAEEVLATLKELI